MGYDSACTLKFDGKTLRGTAWLEQKDLLFRGPQRLVIPFSSISSATAREGTLLVKFDGGSAEFSIGDAAEKWAKRITNPPSRLDKLGVKAGMTVSVIGVADRSFLDELAPRAGRIIKTPPATPASADMIFYGANDRDALARLAALSKLMVPSGALWVVRPKGRPEITEAETMAAGKKAGLVDVKVVSFSDTHTAEKFMIPVAKRAPASKPSRPRR
jgi:hypothetical protein